jgi:hypothetical protein
VIVLDSGHEMLGSPESARWVKRSHHRPPEPLAINHETTSVCIHFIEK